MSRLWMIVFLTLVWCGFSNDFTPMNIVLGILVSVLCNRMVHSQLSPPSYGFHPWHFFTLIIFIGFQLLKSSLEVAWEIITPKQRSHPRMLTIPLRCTLTIEKTLLANLLSLAPGTLSIDLTADKQHLIVHCMFADSADDIAALVKNKLEPKVLRAFNHD